MAHQDLPESAPASPHIKRVEKRLMTFGCAPAMIGGMLAFAAPSAATIGFGLTLLVAVPILVQARRLRGDNQRRWSQARARAMDEGLVVKTAETADGDHDYRLLSQAEHDRERWGDDLDRWQAQRAEHDSQGLLEAERASEDGSTETGAEPPSESDLEEA